MAAAFGLRWWSAAGSVPKAIARHGERAEVVVVCDINPEALAKVVGALAGALSPGQ
jgi:hypothetical protein